MRFFLLAICIMACFLNGCGGKSGSLADVPKGISVKVTDGVIKKARVHLMSLKKGIVSRCETDSCVTDSDGQAKVVFSDSDIKELDSDDVLYLWVDSTSDTAIQTSSDAFTLVSAILPPDATGEPDLVQLKSILSSAKVLQDSLSAWPNISEEITRATTVSNLTHAKSLLVERDSGIRLHGPDNLMGNTNADGANFYRKLQALEQDLQISPPTDISKKWFLLATATMARLHEGLVPDDGSDDRSTDDMLYDLTASSGVTLGATFATGIDGFWAKVQAQLNEPDHKQVVNLPAGKSWDNGYTNLVSVGAIKNATTAVIDLLPIADSPKVVMFLPYSGQHDVLSLAYQSGVSAALSSTDAFAITTIDSSGLNKDSVSLRFYGEDSQGNVRSDNIISDPNHIAILSYLSWQTHAFASHHDKEMLVLSSSTATIFEQDYKTVASFVPSNRVQADSIAMLLSKKAQEANTNIPYILFVEGVADAADYSEDMYASLLSRQFSSDIRVDKTGMITVDDGAGASATQVAAYAQLIGSFNLKEKVESDRTELVFPSKAIKSLLKNRTGVNAVYVGYLDNFKRLLTAFKADTELASAISHWYSVDGVMSSRIPTELAEIYGSDVYIPQVSILTMGKVTSGSDFDGFAADLKALPSIDASHNLTADLNLSYYQIGYDMGKYLLSVVNTINSSATLKLNKESVLSIAKTQVTSLPGLIGSGGTKVNLEDRGWYDQYDINCSDSTCECSYAGKISVVDLFN